MSRILLITMCFIAASFFMRSEALADSILLSGHRAVYNLSLLKGEGAKAPIQAQGSIIFEFSGSECQGYVQNFHQFTEIQPAEGQTKFSVVSSATYEEPLSKEFRFRTVTKLDNAPSEQVEGVAERQGKTLIVHRKGDTRNPVIFQGEILFPTEHLIRILKAAYKRETLLEARVYDGNGEGDKSLQTLTIIGNALIVPAQEKIMQSELLKGLPRWPIVISYYDPDKSDNRPVYTLSFDLYANGVSSALRLDYGDFILVGEMRELNFFPTTSCLTKK
jgi:EipB-like